MVLALVSVVGGSVVQALGMGTGHLALPKGLPGMLVGPCRLGVVIGICLVLGVCKVASRNAIQGGSARGSSDLLDSVELVWRV